MLRRTLLQNARASIPRAIIAAAAKPKYACSFSTSTFKMSEMQKIFSTNAAAPVGPYSQAVKVGGQVFVSGQIPADKNGNLVEGSIADKTKASCEGMKAILEEAGSSISKVVKVRAREKLYRIIHCMVRRLTDQTSVFLTDMKDFAEMNSIYEQYFTHKPARSCVAVKELPKGVPVEIECIALA